MGDYVAAIRDLLIREHGVPDTDVTLGARLLHDLGVDGDDAAEVFQALHQQFGTDFAALDDQWREFFNTEGASPIRILIGIPVILICGGLAGVLVAALHWPEFLAIIAALALFLAVGWSFGRLFGKPLRPVTVGGLAEIVRAGQWPTNPDEVR
ncbi:acyl carrier protein [Sphingomonas lenta]|uniref:Uncharacterized protein n=1 Tax=Sphingomonas lenta TaxID=1141887 RepID=A0A2A2SB10_9SPHN|nr:hypothetical protein [Sphingomonas lenta]PAX06370.1 hypothetical protein CKY28_17350 [Sphingomonas lenta]